MVEDVVEIYAHLEFRSLTESEKLAQTHVYAPRSRPNEKVSFRDVGVVENISACRRHRKRSGIKELIPSYACIRIANHARTKTWTTEVADCIDKAAGDVARENRTTVVASPERRKPGAALGKHVPRNLKATHNRISRSRE